MIQLRISTSLHVSNQHVTKFFEKSTDGFDYSVLSTNSLKTLVPLFLKGFLIRLYNQRSEYNLFFIQTAVAKYPLSDDFNC